MQWTDGIEFPLLSSLFPSITPPPDKWICSNPSCAPIQFRVSQPFCKQIKAKIHPMETVPGIDPSLVIIQRLRVDCFDCFSLLLCYLCHSALLSVGLPCQQELLLLLTVMAVVQSELWFWTKCKYKYKVLWIEKMNITFGILSFFLSWVYFTQV